MLMPSIYGENLFDELFDDFLFFNGKDLRKAEKKLNGRKASRMMSTDVKEKEGAYELVMDLLDLRRTNRISLENGYLTIQAAKELDQSEKDKETGKYIRKERYAGACSRSFYIGEEVVQEEVRAEFKHGILKLTIPKKEQKPVVEQNKYIAIEG